MPTPTPALPIQYQLLFRALPEGYLLLAPDGTILENNDIHEGLGLRDREEIVGKNIFDAYPPTNAEQLADLSAAQEYVRQHLVPRTTIIRYDLEQPATLGGGYVVRYWEILYQPILDDEGQLLYILQRPRDITEQFLADERARALQAQLTEAENFAQFVLDTMPLLVATTAADGMAEYFNPRWTAYTGKTTAELRDNGWAECVHPDDRPLMLRQRNDAVTDHHEAQYEFRLRRYDGQYRWMMGRTTPRLDEQGQVRLRVGVSIDIHEQKAMVQELMEATEQQVALVEQAYQTHQRAEQQREMFYSLFMQAPEMIAIMKGPNHKFDFVNPPYQSLFPGREIVGKTVMDIVPEAGDQGFLALLDGVYQTGDTFVGREIPLSFSGDGSEPRQVYFTFTYQAFREDGEIVGVSCFATDVTEQVKLREALSTVSRNHPA